MRTHKHTHTNRSKLKGKLWNVVGMSEIPAWIPSVFSSCLLRTNRNRASAAAGYTTVALHNETTSHWIAHGLVSFRIRDDRSRVPDFHEIPKDEKRKDGRTKTQREAYVSYRYKPKRKEKKKSRFGSSSGVKRKTKKKKKSRKKKEKIFHKDADGNPLLSRRKRNILARFHP